ncbi:MAG: hypothetical protein QOD66_3277 [Solirubrobacteraceae bacterium]|nr:hypothetical protein [Solirubrobacteraceae bacterium]
MSDPPGVPSALGIEAVEWFARGDENLTVRVTGRWRRRRPGPSGQPLLVIEAGGQRHRFPAMPEPPGLTGAAPGTWQLSFTVPASLAPPALERAWLQMGAVVVPLPVAVDAERPGPEQESPDAPAHADHEVSDPQLLAERRLRSSELALQATRMRATQAEQNVAELAARVEELERELDRLRAEPARLQALVAKLDAARRVAEQRAHAERAMRTELQDELAQREGEDDDAAALLRELQLAHAWAAELEAQIVQLRRQADEAEQIAAAARVVRERAERALAQREATLRASRQTPALAGRIAAEARLVDRLVAVTVVPVSYASPRRLRSRALAAERRMILARGRRARPEGRSAATVAPGPERALLVTLAALRGELVEVRSLSEAERERRRAAEARARELERQVKDYAARCTTAYDAIEQLRGQLDLLRPGDAQPRSAQGRGKLDPARLDAALSRLREAAAMRESEAPGPPSEAPGPPSEAQALRSGSPGPWLARIFASLAERDPGAAGRLLLALLPAQGLVSPRPLAYDLVLDGLGCIRVSVEGPEHTAAVQLTETPRPMSAVQFALSSDPSSLAALVASGSLRRRFGRRRVRISGDRRAASVLLDLVRTPLTLGELVGAGVRVDPWLALTISSMMIDPAWTRGERFSIAFQEPESLSPGPHLHVRDGRRPSVSETRLSVAPATRIVCAGERLLPVLAGQHGGAVEVRGETRPLALLQQWIERAQSG